MENTKILTEVQIKAIEELAEIVRKCVEYIVEIVKSLWEALKKAFRAFIETYHSKRAVHLALHHKDLIVRKKNTNRILRWLRRYIRCKE